MLNEIVQGDNRKLLADIPANSMDAVITDPEYRTASETKVTKRSNKLVEFNIEWDQELKLDWIPLAAKTLKPGGAFIIFTDNAEVTSVWNAIKAAGLTPLQTIYWIKTNPPPQPRKNFCSGVETAIFARKPGKIVHWAGGGITPNYIYAPICTGQERTAHPTQKPLSVIYKLVRLVVPTGGVVLDPFAGSGTTGEAAIKAGCNFILMELDQSYYQIASKRLEKAMLADKSQTNLFELERLNQARFDLAV